MSNALQNISFLFEQVGLGVLLVYLYGVFARRSYSQHQIQIRIGAVFGLAALLAMGNPIVLSYGIIVDLRNLFIGVAAAFFGWRGGFVSVLIAIGGRLIVGGDGVLPGSVAIILAALLGLAWAHNVAPRIKNDFLSHQLLALMITGHVFAGVLLPTQFIALFFYQLAPLMLLGNMIGTAIFGILINREMALVGQARLLRAQAMTDPLTKILNRRSAVDAYHAIQKAPPPNRGIAMTCIDVDKFKAINDTFGHLAGDQVLQEIAHRIGTCLRADNIVCRMSGDEFLFVLVNVTSIEAKIITERCRSLISRIPVSSDEAEIPVTISLGTVWSAKPLPFEEFRSKADEALFNAKNGGRDRTAFAISYADKNALAAI